MFPLFGANATPTGRRQRLPWAFFSTVSIFRLSLCPQPFLFSQEAFPTTHHYHSGLPKGSHWTHRSQEDLSRCNPTRHICLGEDGRLHSAQQRWSFQPLQGHVDPLRRGEGRTRREGSKERTEERLLAASVKICRKCRSLRLSTSPSGQVERKVADPGLSSCMRPSRSPSATPGPHLEPHWHLV